MENEDNKNLQGRREFFKEAAKKALPILGAVVMLSNPVIAKTVESSTTKSSGDCGNSCTNSCYSGCSGECKSSCLTNCSLNCKGVTANDEGCGGCSGRCFLSCSGECSSGCKGSCHASSYKKW